MTNVSFGGASTGAYIVGIIQVLKLERIYGETILANSIPWQITTLLSTKLIGYGCAGMARRFLVYPAPMIWPKGLANIELTKALFDDDGEIGRSANGCMISRYKFFYIAFGAMFLYYWIPNYVFTGVALFNWPTWISPVNVTLALIAGATFGLGLNPLPSTLESDGCDHSGRASTLPSSWLDRWDGHPSTGVTFKKAFCWHLSSTTISNGGTLHGGSSARTF